MTWKPLVSQILTDKSVHSIFDSSKIPGEILDLLVVRTEVLNRADGSGQKFAKAISGRLVRDEYSSLPPDNRRRIKYSAAASGDSIDSYKEQLKTTSLFATPKSAADFTTGPMIKQKMDLVRQFCFAHGLLGQGSSQLMMLPSVIQMVSIQGNKDRVRLRFNAAYMQAAQQGKL